MSLHKLLLGVWTLGHQLAATVACRGVSCCIALGTSLVFSCSAGGGANGTRFAENATAATRGTLSVPKVYGKPQFGTFEIEYLEAVPPGGCDPGEAILVLAGGPGQDVRFLADMLASKPEFAALRDSHRLVFANIRGADKATSRLACTEGEAWSACVSRIHRDVLPLSSLTSPVFARDLDALRGHLGVERWQSIVATSYGTRLAMRYADIYPSRVSRLVLANPVTVAPRAEREDPVNHTRVFDRIAAQCAADSACKTYGPLEPLFDRAVNAIAAIPREFQIGSDGVSITAYHLVNLVRQRMRSRSGIAEVPRLLSDVATFGGASPALSSGLTRLYGNGPPFLDSLYFLVTCNEGYADDYGPPESAQPAFELSFTRFSRQMARLCEPILELTTPDPPQRMVGSPSLPHPGCLLVGALDPITPPQYAAEIATTSPSLRTIELANTSHEVLQTECGRTIATQCALGLPVTSCAGSIELTFK